MADRHSPEQISDNIKQAVSHPWFERLARFGIAAKGVVYFVVGLLAAQAAFGSGGKTTDTKGALFTIVSQPFGKFLLALIAIGMIGYALWRITEAVLDPEHAHESLSAKRVVQRIGYGFSGLVYAGLAFTAIKLVAGTESSNSGNATQDWTARVLSQPFGQWLVGIAGAIVIGVGLKYLYEAYKEKFYRDLQQQAMNQGERTWARRVGRFGIAARGIVFTIIGVFLIVAAVQADAREAKGFGDALATLASQPFGPWLLGVVALGLIAFGIYCLFEARYRQITRPV